MQRRAGVTLLEVLTAMFIMAIGMLALLTLFPLGALNMAQALKDDRAASAAHSAGNFAAAMNLRQDPNIINPPAPAPGSWYQHSPNPATNPPYAPLLPTYTGPGFPVFIDAYGTGQMPATAANPNGDIQDFNGNPVIRRLSPSYVTNPPASNSSGAQDRWFCLLDDITFTNNGSPDLSTGAIDRAGKFTWCYLLQPVSASNTSTVRMSVLVYWGRNIGAGSLTAETAATCTGNLGDTSITNIAVNNAASPGDTELPRRGSWILDITPNVGGVPQGYFYQVINVDPSGTVIDVQPALKAAMTSFVIFNDVHFVADKGTSTYP